VELVQNARDLYEKGEFHDALQAAQAAADREPSNAAAWSLLARIARHLGMPAASDIAFERAVSLSTDVRMPHRISRDAFTRLVLDKAPSNTHVHIEDLPGVDAVRSGVSPDALVRHDPGSALVLYQANFENQAASEQDLAGLVSRSLADG
jgi:hypothetical protein